MPRSVNEWFDRLTLLALGLSGSGYTFCLLTLSFSKGRGRDFEMARLAG